LDLITVELTDVPAHAVEGQLPPGVVPLIPCPPLVNDEKQGSKFTFTRNGTKATGWHKHNAKFLDRWGNESREIDSFCKAERFLKIKAEFARNEDASFLPEEKWIVPIQKVPSAGQVRELFVTNELQGLTVAFLLIGGPGEYKYEDGRIVSATNKITSQQVSVGLVQNPQSKLSVKHPMSIHGDVITRLPGPITIVSEKPYVICETQPARNTLIYLLESDPSAQSELRGIGVFPSGFSSRMREGPYVFIPLIFEADQRNKALTVIGQRTRKAEFVFQAPQR